jgi:hypothetical protein
VSEDMAVKGAGSSGATRPSLFKRGRGRGRPRKVRGLLWAILKKGRARVGRPRGNLTRGDLARLAFDVALYRLAITHIFPCCINSLLAILEVVFFRAEPFERPHVV